MSELLIESVNLPDDEKPEADPSEDGPNSSGNGSDDSSDWYDPLYPYSTQAHPYGYFSNTDGTPDFNRPRKRKPHGARTSGKVSVTSPASEKQARQAAGLLAQMNLFIGMGIHAAGMPMTAHELKLSNERFEEMAFNALLNDPALCRKILGAGMASGRAQLTMAYIALGGSLVPLAMQEIKVAREQRATEEGGFAL